MVSVKTIKQYQIASEFSIGLWSNTQIGRRIKIQGAIGI